MIKDSAILHICNNYIGSKVNSKLIKTLQKSVKQLVIVPYRDIEHLNKNIITGDDIEYHYVKFNNSILKFTPLLKVIKISILVIKSIGFKTSLSKNSEYHILAHTLWSDGFVAFFMSKLFGFKYTLVVRNTDINIFIPKLPHYRWLIKKIISNSSNLIFLSKAYEKRFIEKYPYLYSAARRVSIIPNGIDAYWIDNALTENTKRKKQICFVGSFVKNKNISAIYKASLLSKCKIIELELVLIGGSEKQLKNLLGISAIPNWIKVIDFVNEKSKILDVYRKSRLFIMPSFTESFGLVYLEAFSQGCSIICSKGEGIDGFFVNEEFIIPVDPNNNIEISDSIIKLINLYPNGVKYSIIHPYLDVVRWEEVAANYTKNLQ